MKYLIILGDGMADTPIPELGNMTPLQAANTPTLDRIAEKSIHGTLNTVPDGFSPGSEIAHLSLLGYDVKSVYEGRGSLEATSIGVNILPDEMAMRCNLVNITGGILKNHSAGHITTKESDELIKALNEGLSHYGVSFHTGVSYRNLLKIKNGRKEVLCTPPHDVPGTPFRDILVKPEIPEAQKTAGLINRLILESQQILENHPVNLKRKAAGKDTANSIWPWSPGYKPEMEHLFAKYPIKNGVVISAVDLILGIGIYAGLKPILVDGATGLYDTNYEGKAAAALEALETNDFVFLHIEASDEAGHEGDYNLKVKTIENFDSRICKPVFEALDKSDADVRVAVLPDHPTPCAIRTHSADPVPVMIYDKNIKPDGIKSYNEFDAKKGSLGNMIKDEFMNTFLRRKSL